MERVTSENDETWTPSAKREMAQNSGATANRAVGPNGGTACHTHTTSHRSILADSDVVPNLNQVVELDTILNDGVTQGTAVNAGVGADLHIVANAHGAELFDLFPGFTVRGKAKSVGANHHPWVKNAALTHHAAFADGDMGLENGASTNTRTTLDHAQGTNEYGCRIDCSERINHCAGMNALLRRRGMLTLPELRELAQVQVRLVNNDACTPASRRVGGLTSDDDAAGSRRSKQRTKLWDD